MAVQILSLASDALPTVPTPGTGDLYTSPTTPTPLTTIVKSIRIVNTNTTPVIVNLYFKESGRTERRIAPRDMTIPAGGLAIDDQEITMGSGDKIRGDASAANVEYVISGIQR